MSPAWRRVCMTLAVLALAFRVAVPAGYMLDTKAEGAPAIILCTAQGLVSLDAHDGHPAAPDAPTQAKHDTPCAFAGHGTAFVAAEPLTAVAVEFAAYAAPTPAAAAYAVPGRGLVAAPLPARGPPQAV